MRACLKLALAALAPLVIASAEPAEAATYQKSVVLNCSADNSCVGTFPTVPAGKVLRISYVSCAVAAPTQIIFGHTSAIGIAPVDNFEDGAPKHILTWSYNPGGGNTGGTTSAAITFEVKSGKQAQIRIIVYSGERQGICNISGNMLKL